MRGSAGSYSSDGFLVLGGRDADTNEEIYAKYLERRDLAMHTDAPGAPLTVIKTEGEEVPESTLQEAAQFCCELLLRLEGRAGGCRLLSDQRRSGQQDPGASGEFLKKGGFVIRGERRYFKDTPVGHCPGHSRMVS